ncbi:hypothetical protein [Nevskia soli]|uniref:hypothetical protein n=1 Tax=Nevskia soli TaxID=418856 RepID=UPI0004A6BC33|nr:hypothetical protein [Nevskia soli]
MDKSELDRRIRLHGHNIVAGNFEAVLEDFSERMKPGVPDIAQMLPPTLEKAELLDLLVHGNSAAVVIRYSNASNRSLTIESIWQEEDGKLLIVAAGPVQGGQPALQALFRADPKSEG